MQPRDPRWLLIWIGVLVLSLLLIVFGVGIAVAFVQGYLAIPDPGATFSGLVKVAIPVLLVVLVVALTVFLVKLANKAVRSIGSHPNEDGPPPPTFSVRIDSDADRNALHSTTPRQLGERIVDSMPDEPPERRR